MVDRSLGNEFAENVRKTEVLSSFAYTPCEVGLSVMEDEVL